MDVLNLKVSFKSRIAFFESILVPKSDFPRAQPCIDEDTTALPLKNTTIHFLMMPFDWQIVIIIIATTYKTGEKQ